MGREFAKKHVRKRDEEQLRRHRGSMSDTDASRPTRTHARKIAGKSAEAMMYAYVRLLGLGVLDNLRLKHVPVLVEGTILYLLQVDLNLVLQIGERGAVKPRKDTSSTTSKLRSEACTAHQNDRKNGRHGVKHR